MIPELVIIRSPSLTSLVAQLSRIIQFLDRAPESRLVDVAYTCNLSEGKVRLAVVTDSVQDLRVRLASAKARLENPSTKRIRDKSGTYYFAEPLLDDSLDRLAFVFPGVLSFYPDMMRDLAYLYPECRSAFDELEEALKDDPGGFVPSSFIFPPANYYRHDADIFSSGAYAQALAATYSGCVAMGRLLDFFGVQPRGMAGFAGGDVASMMCNARGNRVEPARSYKLGVIRELYRLVDRAVDHSGLPAVAMLSLIVKDDADLAAAKAEMPAGAMLPVSDLSPRQKVYAVRQDCEAEVIAKLAEHGIKYIRLAANRPFNTDLCAPVLPTFRHFAQDWLRQNRDGAIDYSCALADKVPEGIRARREDMVMRWVRPVRFRETILKMYDDGFRVFLEVGPRGILSAAVEDTLNGCEHAAIATNSIHRRGLLQFRHALAQLAALGAPVDLGRDLERRRARKLDFDSAFATDVRRERELRLSRRFPRPSLAATEGMFRSPLAEPRGAAKTIAIKDAVEARRQSRQRQFENGAMNPLISDAETIEQHPDFSVTLTKKFKVSDFPFIADFAVGTSQLSYSDPNLHGLMLLTMPVGAEIMAELATKLAPNRELVAIVDLQSRKTVEFKNGELSLFVKADRVASGDPNLFAIKATIQTQDDIKGGYTWPIMEATFMFAPQFDEGMPIRPDPLMRPRSVHWSGREIYPNRICCGERLKAIKFVEAWAETGLDYELSVPRLSGCVSYTRMPLWQINPLLIEAITNGFKLWRSHERFAGAWSFPFKVRRIEFHRPPPPEEQNLRCYLRLMGVTPKSQLCDIHVSDGNGNELITISGWEEYSLRVPAEYMKILMQPASEFVSKSLPVEFTGAGGAKVSSAYVVGIPYELFERDEELWLKMFSHITLSDMERKIFAKKTGSTARRTEWLFGRIAAKESVRRFMKDYCQARWSGADVTICANDLGKPYAIGQWADFLSSKLDIAIAHTSQFVVALAGTNVKIGVDVESSLRNLSEDFTAGVFNPEELHLAAQAVNASQAIIKFWCAKEAVSKALGVGIRYSPKDMRVASYNAETGELKMRLFGGWVEAFKNFKGRDIDVTVRNMNDHALAFCFIPSMLLGDE